MSDETRQAAPKAPPFSGWDIPLRYAHADCVDFSGAVIESLGDLSCDGYFVTGPAGTGKTHLACAVLRSWAAGHPRVVGRRSPYTSRIASFVTIPEMLLELRASYNPRHDGLSETGLVADYSGMPALVLDDLGAEKSTDWTWSALYAVIAARINWMRPTIVTSNLSLDEIDALDPRLASRLAGLAVIRLGGRDRRLDRREPHTKAQRHEERREDGGKQPHE